MKLIFPVFVIAMVTLVSGCVQDTGNITEPVDGGDQQPGSGENAIEITSSGFEPRILTIDAGDTVTFVNREARPSWPASTVHPTHTIYPEGGGCLGSAFDACRGLREGESYSFTFDIEGSWDYHDHLRPSLVGTIIVR